MPFRVPKYCHHKASGRAYVKVRGVRTYLGPYNSPESQAAYEKLVDRLQRQQEPGDKYRTTVSRLCVEFLKHAQDHYRDVDGIETKEVGNFRSPIRTLVSMYGSEPAAAFGPKKLLALREILIQKHVRVQVNRHIHRIRHVFRWGGEREMVPGSVVVDLDCVKALWQGRSAARESEPVMLAPDGDIEALLQFMMAPVATMVRLQLVTGARPSEVRLMKAGDIDQSGEV